MGHHEHPNVTLFREMEAKVAAEGPLAMGDYLADDVEWHEIGGTEPIRGKASLAERFAGMVGLGELTVDTHATVGDDEHVVQLVTATVTKTSGEQLVYRTAEIYHVRDGKVTARWAFSDDTDRINKFFAGA